MCAKIQGNYGVRLRFHLGVKLKQTASLTDLTKSTSVIARSDLKIVNQIQVLKIEIQAAMYFSTLTVVASNREFSASAWAGRVAVDLLDRNQVRLTWSLAGSLSFSQAGAGRGRLRTRGSRSESCAVRPNGKKPNWSSWSRFLFFRIKRRSAFISLGGDRPMGMTRVCVMPRSGLSNFLYGLLVSPFEGSTLPSAAVAFSEEKKKKKERLLARISHEPLTRGVHRSIRDTEAKVQIQTLYCIVLARTNHTRPLAYPHATTHIRSLPRTCGPTKSATRAEPRQPKRPSVPQT